MYWNIVLFLSAFGLVMGFLSVNGYTQKIEPLIWLVGGMFSAFILARNIFSNEEGKIILIPQTCR